ncbi:MAG: SsrA-binding protein SmpB [Desulfovibrio sp.]|jgi:SsrA-binding protein|nr:SsrA-binding protein SmpB [Desulfovibrio sp.]MBQ1331115.1 SsrA-binding protein SmpB [Desulfovibrio sp.]MBQ1845397.1 SsrA-binding protein SmpB [Desulfovibrio sp.]MBQ2515765.1 SsrA-binding protein SmpB [Desulfovibrio sp.]MBR5051024.1 SsrA-binding protein SmpB [Desulfovibrio sp.]
MSSKKKQSPGTIAVNKKARHLYELSEFLEAGISLTGPEIKSIRLGRVSFQDSYVEFKQGSAFVVNLHIAPYENAGYAPQDPDRDRRLLMHAREIARYAGLVAQKGLTVVPVRMYFQHGKVKLEIAVGRGKKLFDKREDLKRRAEERDAQREMAR